MTASRLLRRVFVIVVVVVIVLLGDSAFRLLVAGLPRPLLSTLMVAAFGPYEVKFGKVTASHRCLPLDCLAKKWKRL